MVQPRDFEAWMKRLPMASGARIAKQLFHAIQHINRTRIPPQHRIRIAKLFTQPISHAIASQEHKFIDATFPLTEKAQLTALISARLNAELASAYKIAVHDLAMTKIGVQERKVLIVALFCAVHHLAETVYRSVLVYDPVPRHVWQELHNLFSFAETNKWATTRVKIPGDEATESTTLRKLYRQILLFAAAAPYRLSQREIRALYRTLPHWTSKVGFDAAVDISPTATRFIVQLKRDQPPLHSSRIQRPLEKPALELDTEPLIRTLRERYEELPPNTGEVQPGVQQKELSRDMLRHLIRTLGGAATRRFQRTWHNVDLNIGVGLSQVYNLISGEIQQEDNAVPAAFSTYQENDRGAGTVFSPSVPEGDNGPVIVPMVSTDSVFIHGEHSGMPGEKGQTSSPPIWPRKKGPAPEPAATATLQTLNESAEGCCVSWRGRDIPGIRIGELVGIQAPDDPTNYWLAAVRWMLNKPTQGLEAGLQLIAPHVFAVTVTMAERRRGTPTQCLLVPELKSAHQPASLVAPVLPFKVGLNLHIRQGEREQKVRLVRLLESTGAFAQFQFEYE